MLRRKIPALFLCAVLLLSVTLAGCSENNQNQDSTPEEQAVLPDDTESAPEPDGAEPAEDIPAGDTVRIGVIKGPTGMGLVQLMEKADAGEAGYNYGFNMVGAPEDMLSRVLSGEVDIAAVPTNMASVLYNRTEHEVNMIAVNTLGVLYILSEEDGISDIADLAGRTVYATGQGAAPEFVLRHILSENGLSDSVTVEYKTEHSELAALMLAGEASPAMLPQPFVTTVTTQNPDINVSIDLNEAWKEITGSELAMGCVVVRTEFLEQNPEAVDAFLEHYRLSAEFVNTQIEEAAELIGHYDIVPQAVAEKAIPKCNIVYLVGDDMVASAEGFLSVLLEAEPSAIGGSLPDEGFYYRK